MEVNPTENGSLTDSAKADSQNIEDDPHSDHEKQARHQDYFIGPVSSFSLYDMRINSYQIGNPQHVSKGNNDYSPLTNGLKDVKHSLVGDEILQYKGNAN